MGDEALVIALEIIDTDISKENDVDAIINRLNRLFKIDFTITKYQLLDEAFQNITEGFETLSGPSSKHL